MEENIIKEEYQFQSLIKRFLSFLIDSSILFILIFILFTLVGTPSLLGIEKYRYNFEQNQICMNKMNDMLVDSKLEIYKSNNSKNYISNREYINRLIVKHINLSYRIYTKEFNNENIILKPKEKDCASIRNDGLAYYFTVFKDDSLFSYPSLLKKYKDDVFYKNFNKNDFNENFGDLPVLSHEKAIPLYKYMIKKEININNIITYNKIFNSFSKIRKEAFFDLKTIDKYLEVESIYISTNIVLSYYNNLFIIPLYLILYFILNLSNIKINYFTLGKYITHTKTLNLTDRKLDKHKKILIIIINLILFSFVINAINYVKIGRNMFNLYFIFTYPIIAFILANIIVSIFSIDHRSLIDIIFNVKQVQDTYKHKIKSYEDLIS